MLQRFPAALRALLGRMATCETMLKSLRAAQRKGELGLLHPMDWRVKVEEPVEGRHRTTWTQCGALQVQRSIGADGVFPYACRVDYLMADLMGLRFIRTKILADGDDCCNNHITGPAFTEWTPQKGFDHHK
jgi:hypothetical protein